MLYSVRAAIDVPGDSPEAISLAIQEVFSQLLKSNQTLSPESALNIFFTQTADLKSKNPALSLRESFPQWGVVPLICAQEAEITGMLPYCIRILVQWQSNETASPSPVYLRGAANLRPDLIK